MIRDAKVIDGHAHDGRVLRRSDDNLQKSADVVCWHGHMLEQVKSFNELLEVLINTTRHGRWAIHVAADVEAAW